MDQPPPNPETKIDKPRDPDPSAREKPQIGKWDHCEVFIGKRGYGKTNLMFRRMLELDWEANGAYKIGHTPEANLENRIYFDDGKTVNVQIRYHLSIPSLDKGIRAYPDDFHFIVEKNDDEGKADALLKYSLQLSDAVKRNAAGGFMGFGKKNPTGQPATPIICCADELVVLEAAGGTAQGKDKHGWFRRFLVRLRHNHIAFLANIQDANMKSYVVLSQATKFYCFRVTHLWAINALVAAGFDPDTAKKLPYSPKFEFHEFE